VRHNRSFDADAQVRSCALRTRLVRAGQVRRYAARGSAVDDAPIEIAEYDPRWVEAFQHEVHVLCDALAPWLVGMPEHIGSTAVPGLAAKPIIDIMAPVSSLEDSLDAIAAAAGAGYVYFPYRAEVMHWFCKPPPSVRTHHLHLVPMGSRLWNERLAFRDALRADENLRTEYRDLKVALAAKYRHDRDGYTDAKAPFIHRVLKGAAEGGAHAA
jgi:GrpB-like predicted nucleotidyltransferase (UPF0157 family)